MAIHPWGAMLPQANSTVIETGSAEPTWMTASESWMMLGDSALMTMGITGAQMFASIASIQGIRSMTHEALTPPFLTWLASMAGIAYKQAIITELVAMSYTQTRATMIPTAVSNQNRIDEAIAEATNFFGVNSPLIAQLNADYAEFTVQNATLGTTYGDVITTATLPTPIPPPPPLGSLAQTAGQAANSLGDAAGQAAQAAQGASQEAAQAASQVSGQGSSAAGGMDQMASMFSTPAQMVGQIPQTLSQAGQGLNPSQLSGVLGQFSSLFNGGSTGGSFSPTPSLAAQSGVLPLGGGHGSGAGGMTGAGGAMGGSGMLQRSTSGGGNAGNGRPVLTGIAPPAESGTVTNASGGARGGMMPPPGGGSHQGSRTSRREPVVRLSAVHGSGDGNRTGAKAPERELFS